MAKRDRRDLLRRRALFFAAVLVALGTASALAGRDREVVVMLLVVGLIFAVFALVLGRRRH